MSDPDPVGVAADHQLIEILRGGGVPPRPDVVARALAAWWREVHDAPVPEFEPIFHQIVGERLFEPSYDSTRDVPATATYPPTHTPSPRARSGWQTEDGSWYARISPDELRELTVPEYSQNGLSVLDRAGITVYTVPGSERPTLCNNVECQEDVR